MSGIRHFEKLRPGHPMAAARVVRSERYAWPGGYLLALVMDDGAMLCPDCAEENYHEISDAHRRADSNGWRPLHWTLIEDVDAEDAPTCAHCSRDLSTM